MKHFTNIEKYREYYEFSKPLHPMLAIDIVDSDDEAITCSSYGEAVSTDFYNITLKKIISGRISYGHTDYDFSNGATYDF
jgi:hypothetical protein